MIPSELEKVVNRLKEAQGKKFKKIPQSLVNAEEILQVLQDELQTAIDEKLDELIKQKIRSQIITQKRTIGELRKKI